MLTLYRRHLKTCPYKDKGRHWKRCRCPIWVDGTEGGIEIRKSLKTRSWEEAERRLQRLKESPNFSLDQARTIKDACEIYLQDLTHGRKLSTDTLRKHRNILLPFQRFCTDKGLVYIKQITFEHLSAFRATWNDQALSAKKKLERFRGFFRFCKDAGWLTANPAVLLKAPVVKDAPTLPFTQDQMVRLLGACDQYPDNYGRTGRANAKRLRAMLLVLRYSGMRIRDAVQLTEDKVSKGRIFLYQQKTGEPVFVPIPSVLNEALETLPGRTSKAYYFWTGKGNPKSAVGDWQRSFRKLFALAKLKGHPHQFRDTFAVELLLQGKSMETVSILLGHTSIKTTQKHYAPWVRARQEKLEAEVKQAWDADPVLNLLEGTQALHGDQRKPQ